MAAELKVEAELVKPENSKKPFKVRVSGSHFKGIVAASLSELKLAACRSLSLGITSENLKVFLDEDMTEVDDEDYFRFLPPQSKLVILTGLSAEKDRGNLQYSISHLERSESHITRSQGQDMTDAGELLDRKVRERIVADPTFFVSLNDNELEQVLSLDPEKASKELGKSKEEIILYHETCERELHRRSELRDATELLRLYKRANEYNSSKNAGEGAKRKKDT